MNKPSSQTLFWIIGIVVILILILFNVAEWTRPRVGTIVLPGGTTYLGPSTKPSQ